MRNKRVVYLFLSQEFSYGNATTEDLWKFLSSSSRKDVGSVMNSWIRELGFPVVKVVLEPPSGGDTNNTVTRVFFARKKQFVSVQHRSGVL